MREVILVGANWCGACKAMKTWFDVLIDEPGHSGAIFRYADIKDADITGEGIASLPAVLFRADGVTVQKLFGAMSQHSLKHAVERLWEGQEA